MVGVSLPVGVRRKGAQVARVAASSRHSAATFCAMCADVNPRRTASRPRAETRCGSAQQQCLGPGPRTKATSRVRAEPRRRDTPNLVKHQRILGHPVPCGRHAGT